MGPKWVILTHFDSFWSRSGDGRRPKWNTTTIIVSTDRHGPALKWAPKMTILIPFWNPFWSRSRCQWNTMTVTMTQTRPKMVPKRAHFWARRVLESGYFTRGNFFYFEFEFEFKIEFKFKFHLNSFLAATEGHPRLVLAYARTGENYGLPGPCISAPRRRGRSAGTVPRKPVLGARVSRAP